MIEQVKVGDLVEISPGLSTSGRSAGARAGNWRVQSVSAGDIQDDTVRWGQLDELAIEENDRTAQHRLRPFDLLLTARSISVKSAMVPSWIEDQTVAVGSLLVLREKTEYPITPYLWLYFTSQFGRAQVASLMRGATILYLPPNSLAQLTVPIPDANRLWQLADLVETSEKTYTLSLEIAEERRRLVREFTINEILKQSSRRR